MGELIGFDADHYSNKEDQERRWFTLRKTDLLTVGQFLISFFFIFDAFEKTRNTSKTAHIVSHALSARETTLANAGLPFKVYIDEGSIFWILRISGVVQLVCALALNFYENPKTKRWCAGILMVIILLVDTVLVNFPKSTHEPAIYAHELNQCVANIGLMAGLLMIFGMRDQPSKFKNE